MLGGLGLQEGRGPDEEGAPEGEDRHVDGAAQLAPTAVRAAEVLQSTSEGSGGRSTPKGLVPSAGSATLPAAAAPGAG